MLHFRGGRAGISRQHYPELDPDFYQDVANAHGDELRSLVAAGCTYVQMDDTNLAYLCDEKMREGMLLGMHLCRGNFMSTHAASGNYGRWPKPCCGK